jgi:hypothetical protein
MANGHHSQTSDIDGRGPMSDGADERDPVASKMVAGDDDVSEPILWRESGSFVALAGSETILAFQSMATENLIDAFEWNEVAVFRNIRGFIETLDDGVVSSTNRSLYLFVATLLAKAWAGDGQHVMEIAHDGVRYSPFFEAFKLATEIEGKSRFNHVFLCRSARHLRTFTALHGDFDIRGSAFNSIGAVLEPGENSLEALISLADKADVVVLDTFRDGGAGLAEKLEAIVGSKSSAADVLLLAKGAWGNGTPIQDVFEHKFDLLSMIWVSAFADRHALHVHYVELAGYDRQSLLPFDGDYSVFVLYFSRAARPTLERAGFRRLTADEKPSAARALQPVGDLVFGSNYYAEITGEIQPVDKYVEPDWRAWKRERDWDPGSVEWQAPRFTQEMDLLSTAMCWRRQPPTSEFRAALVKFGLRRLASPRLVMLNAVEKWDETPLEAIFFMLLAFEIADYEIKALNFLLQCLRFDLDAAAPAGEVFAAAATSSDLPSVLSAVFHYLSTIDSRFGDPSLLREAPDQVDQLYQIEGADRARYLPVRSAMERLITQQ